MKIALLHFRVYETDGVSLEMDKWRLSFEKMGHECLYISGSTPQNDDLLVKELDYRAEYNLKIHHNSFVELRDFKSEEELLSYIETNSEIIYKKLKSIISIHNIDVIVPNNVSSLGFNLPVGIAIGKLAQEKDVKIIYHHHDFNWERERYSTPQIEEVKDYIQTYFPVAENAKHCVINSIAKDELFTRKNVIATIVPNVFDFSQRLWEIDDYNKDLRNVLGIKKNDIVFLQATRIVERKSIELGYRVIQEIGILLNEFMGKKLYNDETITKDTKIHFVLAGLNELSSKKFQLLDELLQSGNIEIHYINDIVDHTRNVKDSKKVYSLWDVYTICDFITYTSTLEGWGNQLLEGLFAKKPMLIYEYPVFKTDIKQFELDLVTIDTELIRNLETGMFSISRELTIKKASEILNLLLDKERYNKITQSNFEIGKDNLSYGNLYTILDQIVRAL